ncbi:four-carbon acid sugar kinase family protein [Larkinella soli]|uniref:four-carbon acid sugar kinase family protein n=1 Tax=Larkinella soli TaxID=1770527 RepID=UPI001E501BD5|nr:four-carbon acid sugar kinase family protein [Larkinella soli]
MAQLPPVFGESLLASLREEFVRSEKTIVVLDDDPTGTQTSYDVTVITSWDTALIIEELRKRPSILFILTNSRSLPEREAVELTLEIGRNLKEAAEASGREVVVISRSDSTLRGHFPAEVNALAEALDLNDAVRVLVPAFIEGGRITIDDVHYLTDNQRLIPVSETPFARDVVFGYRHSHLKRWVEEKTGGQVQAEAVQSVSLDDIRRGGPEAVARKLQACGPGAVCIVNAADYRDLEVVAMGLITAEKAGRTFLYRSSATLVPIRAGMESGRLFDPGPEDSSSGNGLLVVVGSHVPRATEQLGYLLEHGEYQPIEVNVSELLRTDQPAARAEAIRRQTDRWLSAGTNVVIYTSRRLEVGPDAESSLAINATVSAFLVEVVKGLTVRPKALIAKGGITSSDLATKALSARCAHVLGPIIPGVPVWRMQAGGKFPGLTYVVFPGNVGGPSALAEVGARFGASLRP